MGGNVFPGKNRRYSRAEYFHLIGVLTPIFEKIYSLWNIAPCLPSKQDFGDMDVVGIPSTKWDYQYLKEVFSTELVSHNGDVWSLIYGDFQIDLIMSNELEYQFCKKYIGFSDFYNFVGKLAHQLGCKLGHDGLFLPVRTTDTHLLGSICLTRDPKLALKFIDIVPLENPQTIEDIFQNVSESRFFNPELFKLENNTNIARTRDKKRPSYRAFLEWNEKLPLKDYLPLDKDKSKWLPYIFEFFPEAKLEYDYLIEQARLKNEFKLKFNGQLVSEWTGLKDKELGEFMKKILSYNILTPEKTVNWSIQEIEYMIKNMYRGYAYIPQPGLLEVELKINDK